MLTDKKRLFVVVCHEVCGFQWHYSRGKSDDLNFLACREKKGIEKNKVRRSSEGTSDTKRC